MITQAFQVFNLRGMDERWIPDPREALLIRDMFWSSQDSWKTSGGYAQFFEYPAFSEDQPEEADKGSATASTYYPAVRSIHWFAQHNGARQWLIWEQEEVSLDASGVPTPTGKLQLKVFDGSMNAEAQDPTKNDPPLNDLYEVTIGNVTEAKTRVGIDIGIRTQSQAWGGRMYLVNGYDAPIVFDGELVEKAGFKSAPPAPTIKPCTWENTSTWTFGIGAIIASGHVGDKVRYGAFADLPYWGLGPPGFATLGAGNYLLDETEAEKYRQVFKTPDSATAAYHGLEQEDSRRVGWQYRVTYINERGQESEASQASSIGVHNNGTGQYAQHGLAFMSVELPIGPRECVARRVYRTRNLYDVDGGLVSKGLGESYYFLKEIQDNMTTTWVDGHPDTSLGELLDVRASGGYPTGTKFLSSFKNTMFAAGTTSNEIYFSAPLFPEVFPKDNVIHIGDDDGGQITGIRSTKNALVVFKTRGIYLIKGGPDSGFIAEPLNRDVGCWAPDSIAELPGLGLVFLSENSVQLLEGALENTGTITRVVEISAEIPNQMERMNSSAAVNAAGVVYTKDREYWLSLPIDGSEKNNLVLVYHYEVGAWSLREGFPMQCAAVSRDHRGYLFFGSHNSSSSFNSGINVYSRGYSKKGGRPGTLSGDFEPVDPLYETVALPFGSVFSSVQPAHILVYGIGYGNNDLELNYRVNRSLDSIRATSQNVDQQDPNERYPVYGKARWDTDRWAEYRPTVFRFDVSGASKGPIREFQASFAASNGTKIEIIGYDIEAKVGEQRKIKPLNEALQPDRR